MDYKKLEAFAVDDRDVAICKAMEEFGSQRKAAKSVGMSQSALNERLKRLREGEADAPKSKSREKELEKQIEQLEERLFALRGSQFKLPKSKKTDLEGRTFCRITIPDTHGCLVDPQAIAAFLHDLELVKPSEIIMLGDHLECGGFLAQHHTLGYVAQTEYTFDQDIAATNQLLDQIQRTCPHSRIDYIEGNHERRIENWCVTTSLKNKEDAEALRKRFSASSVLELEKRGISWIRQGVFYDGVSIPATIKRGRCYFTHGSSTAKHAASEHVKKFGGNVVYGHCHRTDSYVIRTVGAGIIGAWSPGCLCILQPLWQHTNPTDWSHGYGLQLVSEDGSFLHINVPIIDGKSYLGPLFQAVV